MFLFPFLVGLYGVGIFLIGLLGYYNKEVLGLLTGIVIVVGVGIIFFSQKNIKFRKIPITKNKSTVALYILLICCIVVNLVGAVGPELGFDALWYHLTIPKIYIEQQKILFIPGSLLYYAQLPRLGEMLYGVLLLFGNEIWVKLAHFSFGLFICIALYKFLRKFLNKNESLLILILFYSNLVISWLSITSYVDLICCFFELIAVFFLYNYTVVRERRDLIFSSVMLGLAVSTKIVALPSLIPFLAVLIVIALRDKRGGGILRELLIFIIPFLIIISPWLIVSYLQTQDVLYPLFENVLPKFYTISYFLPWNILFNFLRTFLNAPDPISPIYFIVFPFVMLNLKKLYRDCTFLFIFGLFSLISWYLTPYAGSRFLVIYLPVLSIALGFVIFKYMNSFMRKYVIFLIILGVVVTIGYRSLANTKYVPVILGKETKQEFLLNHLNFDYGDFIDVNGDIKKIVKDKRVLVLDIHNLFYIDFPFDHSTWKKKGYMYDYILTQASGSPVGYGKISLVYQNSITHAKLYQIIR